MTPYETRNMRALAALRMVWAFDWASAAWMPVCKKSHRHEGTFTFTPNTMVGTTQGWLRQGTHIWKPGMVRAMRR